MTKISSYTTNLEWGMDKCPRTTPLLLSFKFLCARCICFSARSPLHTSSDALAKYKDGSPWSAVKWLKLETVSLTPYVTWSGSLRPLTGEHISSASLGLQTNQGMAMVCTCNVAPLALLRATFSPLCRTGCNLSDLLLEDDRWGRECHRFPRDVYRIVLPSSGDELATTIVVEQQLRSLWEVSTPTAHLSVWAEEALGTPARS